MLAADESRGRDDMIPQGKVNLHTHTYYCRHGSGNIFDYMVWAEKENIEVLGFSEHVPLPNGLLAASRLKPETLPFFWKEFEAAAEKYPRIRMLRALEGECIPELMNYQKEMKEAWQLDYMIASNHYIWRNGNKCVFPALPDSADLKLIAEQSIALIESGLGLFFAHPDLFFAYGCPWNDESRAVSRTIIECAKAHRLPLEINGYGMRKDAITDSVGVERKRYPVREFWELAAEIGGVEVVCNSDAHTPSAVWGRVPELCAWARELGMPVVNQRLAAGIPVK